MKHGYAAWLVVVAYSALACGSSAEQEILDEVGGACLPSLEKETDFSGFSLFDVSVEPRACGHTDCLVNHFQGRVSCPYGQTPDVVEAEQSPSAPTRCRVPGAEGTLPEELVTVPVEPQRIYRNAVETVYCSCRCAGPDPSGTYCDCPGGFECTELIRAFGLPNDAELAGSYCVEAGTAYNPLAVLPRDVCEADAARANERTPEGRYKIAEVCGPEGNNP